jgi:hypothetical protein
VGKITIIIIYVVFFAESVQSGKVVGNPLLLFWKSLHKKLTLKSWIPGAKVRAFPKVRSLKSVLLPNPGEEATRARYTS